jgi:predicted nuclease of predicted toxin-antitoxin system
MKLLLDANISWRLSPFLVEHFCECIHVNKTELSKPAKDADIWKFAKEFGYTIITQDTDFLNFLETKGYPPKVILIKIGNINRKQMEEILLKAKQSILDLHNMDEYGLLEII